jgi:hypothetical protein
MECIMAFKVQVGSPQISIHQDQTILTTELDGQINGRAKGLLKSQVYAPTHISGRTHQS